MLKRSTLGAALVLLLTVACESSDPAEPLPQSGGITFTLAGNARTMAGAPATDASTLLSQSFVAARADSVGGIVAVGFAAEGGGKGDLLVLQAPRATGTYSCGDGMGGTPCHGRYIVGVTVTSTAEFQRFFNVVSGTLTLTQIGPDRLRGTFSLTLRAADDQPGGTIEIRNGTLDVPYLADPNANGALECLLAHAGMPGMTCGST